MSVVRETVHPNLLYGLYILPSLQGSHGLAAAECVKMKSLKENYQAESNTDRRLSWRCLHNVS